MKTLVTTRPGDALSLLPFYILLYSALRILSLSLCLSAFSFFLFSLFFSRLSALCIFCLRPLGFSSALLYACFVSVHSFFSLCFCVFVFPCSFLFLLYASLMAFPSVFFFVPSLSSVFCLWCSRWRRQWSLFPSLPVFSVFRFSSCVRPCLLVPHVPVLSVQSTPLFASSLRSATVSSALVFFLFLRPVFLSKSPPFSSALPSFYKAREASFISVRASWSWGTNASVSLRRNRGITVLLL